jgi:hypothetical protein
VIAEFPDPFFVEGMLFWGESLSRETVLSKGFFLDVPDSTMASTERLEELQDNLKVMLGLIGQDMALQIQWTIDSDYQEELATYQRNTERFARNQWSKFTRTERFLRFGHMMANKELRRERLVCFFSRKCSSLPKRPFRVEAEIDKFLAQENQNFLDKISTVAMVMPDCKVRPMDDHDHYLHYLDFFNPSLAKAGILPENRLINYDPDISALSQTLHSDGVMFQGDDGICFKMDEHYHALLVVRRWPQQTYPGMIRALTQCLGRDFSITQNIYPLDVKTEIEKEELNLNRLRGDVSYTGKYSMLTSIAKKESKINALMMGFTLPFNVLTVIRAWDATLDGLFVKTSAIKTAMQNMAGMQYHQANHPAQCKNLFKETLPGYLAGKVRQWDLYAESNYLADLLPVSSTFIGDLDRGEALYEGGNGGLVGIKTFAGKTPQHALMAGMRGAGKSVLAADLLSQTEPFFDYTAIIEEGLSYGIYTKTLGGSPIILHSDLDLTLNYFDSLKMPLANHNIATASALCLTMIGANQDEDKNNYRLSAIGEYINQLYTDHFTDWAERNEEALEEIQRLAYAIFVYRKTKMPAGSTQLEAYSEMLSWAMREPERHRSFLESFSEKDIVTHAKDPQHAISIRNLSAVRWKPNEFPTHSGLVEMLRYGVMSHHKKDEMHDLSTMLSAWCRAGGSNGVLFDGQTNFVLGEKVDHFELGQIRESEKELRKVAGFLISNFVRQAIVSRPRGQRKRLIYEEVSRFLLVPNGDKIVAESYAQMRKFGCWVLTITQQLEQLMQTNLWPVIKGNSTTFIFLRQNNKSTVQTLAQECGLPDLAQHEILNYPLPEHMGRDKYSSATYMTIGEGGVSCGTFRVRPSPEMLYMAASDGEHFDRRAKALTEYGNVVEGIFAEVDKAAEHGPRIMDADLVEKARRIEAEDRASLELEESTAAG